MLVRLAIVTGVFVLVALRRALVVVVRMSVVMAVLVLVAQAIVFVRMSVGVFVLVLVLGTHFSPPPSRQDAKDASLPRRFARGPGRPRCRKAALTGGEGSRGHARHRTP